MSTLENQYSTGKKILKPSDDPIVAVRALKLRTNLSELSQYLEKNIPDAESWMDVTESALGNVNKVISQMNQYCVQGSTDTLTAEERTYILENLKQLKEQIYHEVNSQYAGRYLFTGYKTDTPLIFTEDTSFVNRKTETGDSVNQIGESFVAGYEIKEQFSGSDIQEYQTIYVPQAGDSVEDVKGLTRTVKRLQLSYDELYYTSKTSDDGKEEITTSLQAIQYTIGDTKESLAVTGVRKSTDSDAYSPGANDVYVLVDTGEIVFGEAIAESLNDAKQISVDYQKNTFKANDLRPEHYFECTYTSPEGSTIKHQAGKQDITYEVNFSQSLKVNVEAKDAVTHSVGRMMDDIAKAIEHVDQLENELKKLEEQQSSGNLSAAEQKELEAKIEIYKEALTEGKKIMQQSFAQGMTKTEGFENTVNVAVSDLGARAKRLELTKSRLEDQEVELEDLKSANEDVDLVETVIRYKSAESIYTSSLSAAASVIKTNLLNFL